MIEYYMKETLKLAEKALSLGELPIAAIVVLDGKIIAQAHTAERKEKRLLVHADLLALEQADQIYPFPGKRRQTQLFVNLEPCMMCLGAAMSFFLGELYYGLESPGDGAVAMAKEWKREEEDFPGYQLPKIQSGILREESRQLFQNYTKKHSHGPMWEWAKSLAALPKM